MYNHQYVDEEIIIDGIRKVILRLVIAVVIALGSMLSTAYYHPITKFVSNYSTKLIIAGFVVPLGISVLINRINLTINKMAFFTYSVLTGLLLSYAVFKYGIGITLFSCIFAAGIFAIMALFGYYTKEDLERYRLILKINMFFLICLFSINLYFGIPILYWIIASSALINFTSLIGFDINHIKKKLILMSKNEIFLDRVSLMGTMQFYLDYFVLSLALMSIFGKTFT